jgi:hypothetical protein
VNQKIQTRTLTGICATLMLLTACVQVSPRTAVTDTPMPIVIGRSPASGDSILIPSSGDGTPSRQYTHGEIESHTPDPVSGGDDCVSVIPFTIDWSTNPPTIKGAGRQDCHFQASGECAQHMILAYDVALQGKFTTGDLGEKRLLIDVTPNGSLKEYFVDCPADSIQPPWTEDNPWVITGAEPLPTLNFEYLDGAKVILIVGEGTTTYFLHLVE